jgi:hypothetical protein
MGERLLTDLAPFMTEAQRSSEWPGTKLLDGTACVRQFRIDPESVSILQEAVGSLYDWRQPELPEDLCFFASDGEPWLVSIAHETDAYFYLSRQQRVELFRCVPALAQYVEETSDETKASG